MKRTKEEAMALFSENENLIYSTIHRRFNKPKFREMHGLDEDDIVQYGKIGLYKACQTYDETKGASFSTHAINHIFWSISYESKKDSLGSDSKWSTDLADRTSMDRTLYVDDQGDEHNLYSFLESRTYGYDEFEMENLLNLIADNISERFSIMVKMREEGYVYQEIGDFLGTSHQNIRQQIKYNGDKLMKLLQNS